MIDSPFFCFFGYSSLGRFDIFGQEMIDCFELDKKVKRYSGISPWSNTKYRKGGWEHLGGWPPDWDQFRGRYPLRTPAVKTPWPQKFSFSFFFSTRTNYVRLPSLNWWTWNVSLEGIFYSSSWFISSIWSSRRFWFNQCEKINYISIRDEAFLDMQLSISITFNRNE